MSRLYKIDAKNVVSWNVEINISDHDIIFLIEYCLHNFSKLSTESFNKEKLIRFLFFQDESDSIPYCYGYIKNDLNAMKDKDFLFKLRNDFNNHYIGEISFGTNAYYFLFTIVNEQLKILLISE